MFEHFFLYDSLSNVIEKTPYLPLLVDEGKSIISVKPQICGPHDRQEAPIDMSHLRLFTNDDAEEEKSLVKLFLDQAHEMINIMHLSKNEDKREEWKSAAHRFKGSSGNLGAMQLHHFCTLAEMHFEDNESRKLEMLAAIKQETQRVEKYFNALIPSNYSLFP